MSRYSNAFSFEYSLRYSGETEAGNANSDNLLSFRASSLQTGNEVDNHASKESDSLNGYYKSIVN